MWKIHFSQSNNFSLNAFLHSWRCLKWWQCHNNTKLSNVTFPALSSAVLPLCSVTSVEKHWAGWPRASDSTAAEVPCVTVSSTQRLLSGFSCSCCIKERPCTNQKFIFEADKTCFSMSHRASVPEGTVLQLEYTFHREAAFVLLEVAVGEGGRMWLGLKCYGNLPGRLAL